MAKCQRGIAIDRIKPSVAELNYPFHDKFTIVTGVSATKRYLCHRTIQLSDWWWTQSWSSWSQVNFPAKQRINREFNAAEQGGICD